MIKIIAVDRIKDKNIKNLIDIYLKRMVSRLKVDILEVTPSKYETFDKIDKAKEIESDKILSLCKKEEMIITLDESGVLVSSVDFAKLIFETLNYKHVTCIIGGAYGLSRNLIGQADNVISLSKMTLTHEMARLVLVEQIYRAYTIYCGIKYHN